MAELRTIARPYASAIHRLACKQHTLAAWSEQLHFMVQVVNDERIKSLLNDPKIEHHALESCLLAIYGERIGLYAQNLLRLLLAYHRLLLLPTIYALFEELKAESEGMVHAEIISAVPISAPLLAQLLERLQAKLHKKILVKTSIDERLLGGVKIIIGDSVIDASITGRLQHLQQLLSV